jgi:hypothetical protein
MAEDYFTVDPDRLPTLIEGINRAHENFTWVKQTMERPGLADETMLIGGYGDSGAFHQACSDFSTVFRRELFNLGEQNAAFTSCLERISTGVQGARKDYVALETRNEERMSKIVRTLDEGGA